MKTNAQMSRAERQVKIDTAGMTRPEIREYHRLKRLTSTQRRAHAHRVGLIGKSNIRDFLVALAEGKFAEGPGK